MSKLELAKQYIYQKYNWGDEKQPSIQAKQSNHRFSVSNKKKMHIVHPERPFISEDGEIKIDHKGWQSLTTNTSLNNEQKRQYLTDIVYAGLTGLAQEHKLQGQGIGKVASETYTRSSKEDIESLVKKLKNISKEDIHAKQLDDNLLSKIANNATKIIEYITDETNRILTPYTIADNLSAALVRYSDIHNKYRNQDTLALAFTAYKNKQDQELELMLSVYVNDLLSGINPRILNIHPSDIKVEWAKDLYNDYLREESPYSIQEEFDDDGYTGRVDECIGNLKDIFKAAFEDAQQKNEDSYYVEERLKPVTEAIRKISGIQDFWERENVLYAEQQKVYPALSVPENFQRIRRKKAHDLQTRAQDVLKTLQEKASINKSDAITSIKQSLLQKANIDQSKLAISKEKISETRIKEILDNITDECNVNHALVQAKNSTINNDMTTQIVVHLEEIFDYIIENYADTFNDPEPTRKLQEIIMAIVESTEFFALNRQGHAWYQG